MQTQSSSTRGPIHRVGRTGSTRLPVFRAAAVLVGIFATVNVLWLLNQWGGGKTTQAFTDLTGCLTASIAAIACYNTWRVETRNRRQAWGLLALAAAAWAAGEIIWTFYELALQREVPFPSLADVGFLGGYPLAALAILVLPTSPHRLLSQVRTVIDALVIASALLLVSWFTFLSPIYYASEGPRLEQAIGLAYPIVDVVLVAVVLFVVARAQSGRRTTLLLLALGLMSLAVADSSFAYLTTMDEYATGSPIDAGWNFGYLCIALAAIRHDPSLPRPERSEERRLGLLLPYIAVIAVVVLAGTRKAQGLALDPVQFWGTLGVMLLVLIRQLISIMDNTVLNRNLEAKVRERTAALARSEERHRSLVQNSSDVVTIIDNDGVITYVSPSSERVIGYRPAQIIGRRLVDIVHPDDHGTVEAYLKRFTAKPGEAPVVEWRVRHNNGDWRYCESIGANLTDDPSVDGFVLNTRDISERKELELQLRHQAFHDQLTGSANRALFRDRADHALRRAARVRKPIAVLYVDLDNLKQVNDTYGHEIGDQLLAAVADRCAECIRAEDTVARIGGDEFAILLTDSGGEGAAKHVASRLLNLLEEPFEIGEHTVRSSASIGIALSWGRQEVDELLRNADLAMYNAKNQGKARFELYESPAS